MPVKIHMPLIMNKPFLNISFSVMPHYVYETCAFQVSKSLAQLVSGPATRQGHPSRSVTWRPVSSPENGPGEFELKSITPARFAGFPELHQIVYLVWSTLIPNALLTGYILN
jgi:hypothetical protein